MLDDLLTDPVGSPQTAHKPCRVVVALGGNAITRPGGDDSVRQDYANLRRSLKSIVYLIDQGYEVVLTHGNGPQVGNQMIRVEAALGQAPELPLDVVVADLQGGLGYMIEQVLYNLMRKNGRKRPVCGLFTLVEVDPDDPALADPTKFVGPPYRQDQAESLTETRSWTMKEDRGRGWRRVVPSPQPVSIIERQPILTLVEAGALVIAVGGGGIPVAKTSRGTLEGVEGVIDKDLASAVLAQDVSAEELYILTAVERVSLDFGTEMERPLSTVTVAEAREYMAAGQFPAGSMGPKMEAVCRFVEQGGKRALVTDVFTLSEAMAGKTGTWVVP